MQCSKSDRKEGEEYHRKQDTGEIRGEVGKITGMVTAVPAIDSLEKSMEHLVDGG